MKSRGLGFRIRDGRIGRNGSRSAVARRRPQPGILSQAYQQFHAYSLGNQLLAIMQCHQRGIEPGPMATYPRWQELGRHVKRGEKALESARV